MGSDDRFIATPRAAFTVCHNFIETVRRRTRNQVVLVRRTHGDPRKSNVWAAIHGERYSLCLPLAVPSSITGVRRRDFTSWIELIFRHKNRDWGKHTSQNDLRAREAVQSFFWKHLLDLLPNRCSSTCDQSVESCSA